MELRTKLSDLVGTLQGNEKLERLLNEVLSNTDKLENLRTEISADKPKDGESNG